MFYVAAIVNFGESNQEWRNWAGDVAAFLAAQGDGTAGKAETHE